MGLEDFYPDKRSFLVLVYSFLVILVTVAICWRRKPVVAAEPEEPEQTVSRDTRPILTLNGSALLSSVFPKSKVMTLQAFSDRYRVFVAFQAVDDATDAGVRQQLAEVLPSHRVLFYQTDLGYTSIIRQLSPKVHIEANLAYAFEMRRYIESILMVSEEQCEGFLQVICLEDVPAFLRSLETASALCQVR